MNIKEYEAKITEPLGQATNIFFLTESDVLLALKKRGFGVDKWNGVGGKPNEGESIIDTAIRESQEEIGVTPTNLEQVAIINFFHPYKLDGKGLNMQVIVFIARQWQGEPKETEEMKPQWFKLEDIPYKKMWWDDEIWLPLILKGSKVRASFMLDKDDKVIDQILEEVDTFK
jgi:8-oxo-dGTP pyrophosphatase MutT (NUDIX family)